MKIITIQHIKDALNRIKSLIGETLTTTVEAINEVEQTIPKKVSQLENDAGYLTESTANTTYILSGADGVITLNGSDQSKTSVNMQDLVKTPQITNNLTTSVSGTALDASQGKILYDMLGGIKFKVMSKVEYNSLETHDSTTIYIIPDEGGE